jgi:hypothetical protein
MNNSKDRLYELLPLFYRQRDVKMGEPLRALLQVIAEQVNIVEADIAQLYENWFIETCEDWALPYISDLIGFQPINEASGAGNDQAGESSQVIPRREVANTLRNRRRKGALALLELMATDVTGWPARAVEFYQSLNVAQNMNALHLARGRFADLRKGDALDRIGGPFDDLSRAVDARRISSAHGTGRYNIFNVGLFVWRLKAYSVTQTPAYYQEQGPHRFTFSILGNDSRLYTRREREEEPTDIAGELNLPVPIRRRAFEARKEDYYGIGKSVQVWVDEPIWSDALTEVYTPKNPDSPQRYLIPPERIVVADLTDWVYEPRQNQVAVDPVLGRIAFHPRLPSEPAVWVSYYYGFSADIGGGEYDRALQQPGKCVPYDANHKQDNKSSDQEELPVCILYRVGEDEKLTRINEALERWKQQSPAHAIIEITDSGVYEEPINIKLGKKQTLQIRAAKRKRPIIRLSDRQAARRDDLAVRGESGSRFTLDGLIVAGRGVNARGNLDRLTIRHSTLVPGWALHSNCEARNPSKPSLELTDTTARVVIERSILGSIQVSQNEVKSDPIEISITDSIVDAVINDEEVEGSEAIGAPGNRLAHAALTILRSTIIGRVQAHAIALGENSIFEGRIKVARRQLGCMRFCYVKPNSRTPRRYNCQPDLVERPIEQQYANGELTSDERKRALQEARLRVRPQFNSLIYATATYCQLADACAEEIKRGADDESEMGVFHDLFQPQRAANLRARLDEYSPAGMDSGIIYAS